MPYPAEERRATAVETLQQPVPAALEIVRFRVEELGKCIGELEIRLAPVLSPRPPSPDGKESVKQPGTIAGTLQQISTDIAGATEWIHTLLGRLEI